MRKICEMALITNIHISNATSGLIDLYGIMMSRVNKGRYLYEKWQLDL